MASRFPALPRPAAPVTDEVEVVRAAGPIAGEDWHCRRIRQRAQAGAPNAAVAGATELIGAVAWLAITGMRNEDGFE
jgi:hypothetical protein